MAMLQVLDPTMEPPKIQKQLAPRITDPNGKNLGIRIAWSRFDVFTERIEELLKTNYKVNEVRRFHGYLSDTTGKDKQSRFTPEKLKERDEFWTKSDYAILGLAA